MAFNFTRDGQNYTLDTFDFASNLDSEIDGFIAVNVGGVAKRLALSTKIEKDEASDLYIFVAGKRFALLEEVYFEYFINADTANLNLQTFLSNLSAPTGARVRITINNGIYIYSTSTASAALISGDLSAYSGVMLVNNGIIAGRGGAGGQGGTGTNTSAQYPGNAGGAGGDALNMSSAIIIENNGTIGGGGGGGGGGGAGGGEVDDWKTMSDVSTSGSGGGGGRINGSAGSYGTLSGGIEYPTYGNIGNAGTLSNYGSGGAAKAGNSSTVGGAGGRGGGLGESGLTGGNGSYGAAGEDRGYGSGGAGGAAGKAAVGNSYITWKAVGTRLGSIT